MCFFSPKIPKVPGPPPPAPDAPEDSVEEVRTNAGVKKRRRLASRGLDQFRIPLPSQRPLNIPTNQVINTP